MIRCPLCEKNVHRLKTNSHIIPRWMLADLKEEGRLVKIVQDKVHERAQDNPKFDIVCDQCEEAFRKDDTFSAQFFRYKKFTLRTVRLRKGTIEIVAEVISEEGRAGILSFISSLILRNHIMEQKYNSKNVLGPYFEKLKSAYLQQELSRSNFPIWAVKYSQLDKTLSWPSRSRFDGLNIHETLIYGYRFFLVTDDFTRKRSELIELSNHFEFLIPIIRGSKNKLLQDLIKVMHKNR